MTQHIDGNNVKPTRGFGAMDPEKQRQIARRGGKAAHAKGVAHKYTADEARTAGRKGGQAISMNRNHMAEIGRLGGLARRVGRAEHSQNGVHFNGVHSNGDHAGINNAVPNGQIQESLSSSISQPGAI